MPFMYPEELAKLRADHPGIQYDGYGRAIGATPPDSVQQAANAIYQLPGMQPNAWDFGPTRSDFQNSKDFVGPMPQQWWDPNGELAQQGLGALVSGQDLPDVGFYSQWNPDTNSWVRHGAPSGAYRQPGSGRAARPQNLYVQRQTSDFGNQMVPPEVRGMRQRALHAGVDDLIADAKGNNWGVNPLYPYTYAYKGYGAPYPYDHDDGSGEFTPGV